MKKTLKIGLSLVVVGLIVGTVGFANGGAKVLLADHQVAVPSKKKVLTRQEFDQVNINVDNADVVIKSGDHYQVSFTGSKKLQPTVNTKNRQLTVSQSGKLTKFNNYREHQIVITVPNDKQLSGKINMKNGDLDISRAMLKDATVKSENGDIDFHNVKLNGGQTTLSNGDFEGHRLTLQSNYQVENNNGDNEVTKVRKAGFVLRNDNGSNELFGKEHDGGQQERNTSAAHVLTLINHNGDNEVE
jgi:autonomous glycyl radical cofactor GrcA